jgi:hypothetical protein
MKVDDDTTPAARGEGHTVIETGGLPMATVAARSSIASPRAPQTP